MVEVAYWTAAILLTVFGMASLSLSLPAHWRQVTGIDTSLPSSSEQFRLRLIGYGSLIIALLLCLAADHPTMAVLVWVMLLSVAAKAVATILTWRQQWLRPFLWLVNRTSSVRRSA